MRWPSRTPPQSASIPPRRRATWTQPLESAVDGSVPERVDPPYDGADDDMELDEQDWADEEEPGPPDRGGAGPPTEELHPSDGREDEPPPLGR